MNSVLPAWECPSFRIGYLWPLYREKAYPWFLYVGSIGYIPFSSVLINGFTIKISVLAVFYHFPKRYLKSEKPFFLFVHLIGYIIGKGMRRYLKPDTGYRDLPFIFQTQHLCNLHGNATEQDIAFHCFECFQNFCTFLLILYLLQWASSSFPAVMARFRATFDQKR